MLISFADSLTRSPHGFQTCFSGILISFGPFLFLFSFGVIYFGFSISMFFSILDHFVNEGFGCFDAHVMFHTRLWNMSFTYMSIIYNCLICIPSYTPKHIQIHFVLNMTYFHKGIYGINRISYLSPIRTI